MSTKKHALETLNFAHGILNKALDGFEGDKAMAQAHPTGNHALWTMGHLATTYWWLTTLIDPSKAHALPESYNALFGMGSKCSTEKAKYPPASEVKATYNKSFDALAGAINAIPENDLWSKCASDSHGFASSKIDVAYKAAWHDGWHIGQVTDCRRVQGMPSIF
jgi:hypothetical protein